MRATKASLALGVVCSLAVMLPLATQGQQTRTVAELLGKGGKRLTKEEVQTLASGATISGTSMNNPAWSSEYTYNADGTMRGSATRMVGRHQFVVMEGRWSVSDDGQLCTERTGQAAAAQLYCDYYFAVDGKYYAARAVEDATPVVERNVRRR